MYLYVSKNHNRLNGKPFAPEEIGERVCLNPKYPAVVKAGRGIKVLLDSGAFQDRKKQQRLTFSDALTRQLDFEIDHGFESELIVSYDRLVDEADGTSGRNKKRVAHSTATRYVKETVDAAAYLVDHRRDLGERNLVLSCQGVNSRMYLQCMDDILEMAEPEDVIGMGGFCIVGQRRRLASEFFQVLEGALPRLVKTGIKRLHFFGVGYFPVLVRANLLCRRAGIVPSYDTSSYEFNGTMGRVFNPLAVSLNDVLPKADKRKLYHPADLALMNIRLVQNFWDEVNALPLDKASLLEGRKVVPRIRKRQKGKRERS